MLYAKSIAKGHIDQGEATRICTTSEHCNSPLHTHYFCKQAQHAKLYSDQLQDQKEGTFDSPGLGCTTTSQTDPPPRLHLLAANHGTIKMKTVTIPNAGCTAEVVTQCLGRQCIWAELHETGGLSATLAVSRPRRCHATRPWAPTRGIPLISASATPHRGENGKNDIQTGSPRGGRCAPVTFRSVHTLSQGLSHVPSC